MCGIVFNDANHNGIQDAGETGIEGVKVFVCQLCDGSDTIPTETGPDGFYRVFVVPRAQPRSSVLIPTGTQASPANVGGDDAWIATACRRRRIQCRASMPANGFADRLRVLHASDRGNPGTGTPGYWKNHPEAWPVASRQASRSADITYTKAQAISWLGKVGKDKTTTMFSSLVPAMLNLIIGNVELRELHDHRGQHLDDHLIPWAATWRGRATRGRSANRCTN